MALQWVRGLFIGLLPSASHNPLQTGMTPHDCPVSWVWLRLTTQQRLFPPIGCDPAFMPCSCVLICGESLPILFSHIISGQV